MKILFACDLDDTLIHSYKHKNSRDICIELLKGSEQSYISEKTLFLLRQVVKQLFLFQLQHVQ